MQYLNDMLKKRDFPFLVYIDEEATKTQNLHSYFTGDIFEVIGARSTGNFIGVNLRDSTPCFLPNDKPYYQFYQEPKKKVKKYKWLYVNCDNIIKLSSNLAKDEKELKSKWNNYTMILHKVKETMIEVEED
jgi:hypothetical protein